MKTWMKVLIGLVLSLSFCFTCVGYAALTGSVNASVNVAIQPQEGVFISGTEIGAGVNADVPWYGGTNMKSTVTLDDRSNASVTFTVNFYNNSSYVYVFKEVQYIEGAQTYDNTNIQFAVSGMKGGDEIAAKGRLSCQITFSYVNGNKITDQELNSLLNFVFVPADEYIPEIAAKGALDKFKEILNTSADHQSLLTQMDKGSGSRHDSSYIGNVVGATSEDTKLLNTLFTEDGVNHLTLDIEGEKTNVTAMIKRKNADGQSTGDSDGNEMIIYMTAADIADLPNNVNDVVVYVGVFTKLPGATEWTQVGPMYEGKAAVNNYYGYWWSKDNSINTETWYSSYEYYGVAKGSAIEPIAKKAYEALPN